MINNDASSFLMFRSMWMFILPVSWHLHAIHSVNKGTILQESKMYILRYLVIAYYQELYIEIINFLQACVIFWITVESLYKCAISSYSHFLTFFFINNFCCLVHITIISRQLPDHFPVSWMFIFYVWENSMPKQGSIMLSYYDWDPERIAFYEMKGFFSWMSGDMFWPGSCDSFVPFCWKV